MDEKKRTAQNIIDYVEKHLSLQDGLSLDDIADHAGYSKFYLNRLFCEVTGCTIYKYVKERRLSEAAKKLVQEENTIAEIAYEAAYQSQQAFTLAFKNAYRCTPQTYRNLGIYKELRGKGIWRCAA